MKDTRTVSSHVETVVKTLLSRLANRSFTRTVALPTIRAAALPAGPHAVTGNLTRHAHVAQAANTTRPLARPVDVPPPYHLSPVKAVPSIVAIASRPNVPPVARAATSHAAIATTATATVMAIVAMVIAAMAAGATTAVGVIATAVIAAIIATAGSSFSADFSGGAACWQKNKARFIFGTRKGKTCHEEGTRAPARGMPLLYTGRI